MSATAMMTNRHSQRGFTLIELMMVVTVLGILAAMAVPGVQDLTGSMRLAQGAREVERELQSARLKAVTTNRPIRVRFNCPVAGEYRMVELIGTPSQPKTEDSASNRCQSSAYPYPAADHNPVTRPNHDGPPRKLPREVSFGTAPDLEFWPDGSVHQYAAGAAPWPLVDPATGTAVTLTRGTQVRTITVNYLGKITLTP